MGTRRIYRLASATAAERQLPLLREFPGIRAGTPRARDPPWPRPRDVAGTSGEDLPAKRAAQRKEAMREHRLFPTSDSRS